MLIKAPDSSKLYLGGQPVEVCADKGRRIRSAETGYDTDVLIANIIPATVVWKPRSIFRLRPGASLFRLEGHLSSRTRNHTATLLPVYPDT